MSYYIYSKNDKLNYTNDILDPYNVIINASTLDYFKSEILKEIQFYNRNIKLNVRHYNSTDKSLDFLTKILSIHAEFLGKEVNHVKNFIIDNIYISVIISNNEIITRYFKCTRITPSNTPVFVDINDLYNSETILSYTKLFETFNDALTYHINCINNRIKQTEEVLLKYKKRIIQSIKNREFYIKLLNKLNNSI